MTTMAFTEMDRLRERLEAEPSVCEAKLTTFASGSAMLDVRRAGRAFVMAYTPSQGFCVDELHQDDGFVAGYRYVFEDFASADAQLRKLTAAAIPTEGTPPSLSLVVLQSRDIEAARNFYSLLGLSFAEEQHGTGPRHYAANLGSLVLEIYPCRGDNPATPLRVGFRIPFLNRTLDTLRSRGVRILSEAKDSPWGRRAVLEDPDGNRVELVAAEAGA